MLSFHSVTAMRTFAALAGRREPRQFVIMRGDEAPAEDHVVQMLQHRPGDGKPVEGRRSAPDLVEDHEAAAGGLVEDRGGLRHLDHEGGAPRARSSAAPMRANSRSATPICADAAGT